MPWKEPRPALACWLLAALTLACLLPFAGKAVHMDDPLFIWTAKHIQAQPIDFYGFSVDWGYEDTPMTTAMQNPPLAAYYMAAVGAIFGWSEVALHCGYILPALALVLGTYALARKFCSHPFTVALLLISSPVFMISSTGLMCDTMMSALWVWAVFFWIKGLEPENPRLLLTAATFVAACSLTKYFGICLIPLLLVYSFLQRKSAGRWLLYFLWPMIILLAYQWWTARLYGRGLLADSANMAVAKRTATGALSRTIETLAFCGGCFFCRLACIAIALGKKRNVPGRGRGWANGPLDRGHGKSGELCRGGGGPGEMVVFVTNLDVRSGRDRHPGAGLERLQAQSQSRLPRSAALDRGRFGLCGRDQLDRGRTQFSAVGAGGSVAGRSPPGTFTWKRREIPLLAIGNFAGRRAYGGRCGLEVGRRGARCRR
jgi:hypothetical protein